MILQNITQGLRFRWKSVTANPMENGYKNFNFVTQKSLYIPSLETAGRNQSTV
jgi:hypothetical protein